MENLKIKLPNGHFLVAELCEYGAECPPEISVCIRDEEDIAIQDIVLVRAKQKSLFVADDVNVGAEVLVWADEANEDYTNRFVIEEYKSEEKEKNNLVGFLYQNGADDFSVWNVKVSDGDKKAIEEILKKYQNQGVSVRGNSKTTIEEVL